MRNSQYCRLLLGCVCTREGSLFLAVGAGVTGRFFPITPARDGRLVRMGHDHHHITSHIEQYKYNLGLVIWSVIGLRSHGEGDFGCF